MSKSHKVNLVVTDEEKCQLIASIRSKFISNPNLDTLFDFLILFDAIIEYLLDRRLKKQN